MTTAVTELRANERLSGGKTGPAGPTVVPPGLYSLAFKRKHLVSRFNRGVLELWFAITDFGPYFEVEIPRYYNVQLSQKGRSFTARPQSDFAVEYCSVFGERPKFNCSPISRFDSIYVVGVVQTVTTSYQQKTLPKPAQYSTIRELRAAP